MTDKMALRLLVLDPMARQIFTCDQNGENIAILNGDIALTPDGVFVDDEHGDIYYSLMGALDPQDQSAFGYDGSLWRMRLDGSAPTQLVGHGDIRTPKQITADLAAGKLYWSDREGMRVMRSNLDGSQVETLFRSGQLPDDQLDQTRWCVGIAVDPVRHHFYWTMKGHPDSGEGRICRASYDLPTGATAENRTDVETLFANLPEPIDLELVPEDGALYWTDRGNLSGGNSVSRATIGPDGTVSRSYDVLLRDVGEAIGVAIMHDAGLIFSSSLTGELYRARLDGSDKALIGKFGGLTGIFPYRPRS